MEITYKRALQHMLEMFTAFWKTWSRKEFSRMNTRSAREYMFAPAQILRVWRERRPSNKGDLEFRGGGWESPLTLGLTWFWFHLFLPKYVISVVLRFKWYSLYKQWVPAVDPHLMGSWILVSSIASLAVSVYNIPSSILITDW